MTSSVGSDVNRARTSSTVPSGTEEGNNFASRRILSIKVRAPVGGTWLTHSCPRLSDEVSTVTDVCWAAEDEAGMLGVALERIFFDGLAFAFFGWSSLLPSLRLKNVVIAL